MKLIILSCDKYSDCWIPLGETLEKFWPDCPYDKVLCTETRDIPSGSGFDVVLHCNFPTWSALLLNVCNQVDDEFIMLLLEDQWAAKNVKGNRIADTLNLIKADSSVGAVYLDRDHKNLPVYNVNKSLYEIPFGLPYRMSVCPSIWRVSFLKSILIENENAWEFERLGSFRKNTAEKKILVTDDIVYLRVGKAKLGAVEKGKWEPEIPEFAKKEGIDVDFTKRPVKSRKDVFIKEIKNIVFNISPKTVVKIQNKIYNMKKHDRKINI